MVSHNEKGNILRLDIQIWQGNLYSGCNKFFTSLWHNYITDPHVLHHKIELITPAHTPPHTPLQLLSKTSACWGWAQSCLDAMAVWDMVTGLPSLQTRQHSFWSPGGRKKDLFFHTESLIVWHVSCFYWASGLSGSLADFSRKNDSLSLWSPGSHVSSTPQTFRALLSPGRSSYVILCQLVKEQSARSLPVSFRQSRLPPLWNRVSPDKGKAKE